MANSKPQGLLHTEMSRKEFLGWAAFAVFSLFGLAGILKELRSHAATATSSIEPEAGVATSAAKVLDDTSASGTKAVEFGAELFVLGETEPTQANSGAGIIRPYPTTVVTTNVMVDDGQVLKDTIIDGFVTLKGTGRLENCVVRGPNTPYIAGGAALINASAATWTSAPNISYTTVQPQKPSPFLNGIGNRNYYVYRCKVINATDAMTVAGTSTEGFVTHTRVEGSYLGHNIPWVPDIATTSAANPGGRPEGSHSDVIQFHGNKSTVQDSVWIGNTIQSRHDRTYSGSITKTGVGTATTWPADTDPSQVNHNGVTLTTPTGVGAGTCFCYFEKNWFYGSNVPFNGGGGDGGTVTVINNLFEKRATAYDSPARELVINATNYTRITTPANYYIGDTGRTGPTVPVGNS